MVMSLLFKNAIIKVKRSFGRFVSLFLIIAVGVGFFAGIRASSPDIISSVDTYYDDHNFMDFKIVGSLGLTNDDVNALKKLDNINLVIPSYSLDILADGKAVKIHSLENDINQVNIIEGRMPSNKAECLADDKTYKIGDKIKITNNVNDKLKYKQYTVVGTITSVLYTFQDYGISSIGDGKLSSFLFVNKSDFNLDYYTEIYATAKKTKDALLYSKEYETYAINLEEELLKLKPNQEKIRLDLLKKEASDSLNPNFMTEEQLLIAQTEIDNIEKPKWYLFDRSNTNGYMELKEDTQKVSLIAGIFPLFFILIAVLMSLNTMTRMIEEERGELGTLTSLGFNKKSIISMYLLYVLMASVLGIVGGFFFGSSLIPHIVYSCYAGNYVLPPLTIYYDMNMLLGISAIFITLMALVTIGTCFKELKQNPATLLRPVPPKKGQTIFLERLTFIWKRLSFTWKVTMRNMFRYKKRVFMTIVGISGCTALLLTGFGIKDSIDGVSDLQYGKIFKYDSLIILKNDRTIIDKDLRKLLNENKVIKPALINQTAFTTETNIKKIDINLVIPEDNKQFYKYFNLQNHISKKNILLNNTGVVITQKLAKLLDVNIGDNITIKNTDNIKYTLKIANINENYTMHYVYMDKDLYNKTFDEVPKYNIIVANHNNDNESKLAEALIDSGKVSNVSYTTNSLKVFNQLVAGLNNVILLIIVTSSLLALIVLYNLVSINISERRREIATLKVLGFYDKEVNQYIYRETFVLTLISIGIGLILGIGLHKLVIIIIEVDSTVFLKNVLPISFLWTILITVIFTIIIQFVTYFKLKKIDMIDSLKSIE